MKFLVVGAVVLAIVAGALFWGTGFVGGVVERTVDQRIAEALDRENRRLPRTLREGVVLQRIDYNAAEKQIEFFYRLTAQPPADAIPRMQREANQRTLGNGQLTQAMDYSVQVFHRFQGPTGTTLLEFETTR